VKNITDQLHDIAGDWIVIISDPIILIPLIGGLGIGFLVSICPCMKNISRTSERQFYIYLANVLSSGTLFLLTNLDENLIAVLSMLIVVTSSSIFLPLVYFKIIVKKFKL